MHAYKNVQRQDKVYHNAALSSNHNLFIDIFSAFFYTYIFTYLKFHLV